MDAEKKQLGFEDIVSVFTQGISKVSATYKDISNYIESDKRVFLNITPPILIFWLGLFVIDGLIFAISGGKNCGDYIPGIENIPMYFFCGSNENPILNAVSRFFFTVVSFTAVVELLLILCWLMGKFAKTKYNVTLPKFLDYLVWILLFSPILIVLYFVLFG